MLSHLVPRRVVLSLLYRKKVVLPKRIMLVARRVVCDILIPTLRGRGEGDQLHKSRKDKYTVKVSNNRNIKETKDKVEHKVMVSSARSR